MNVEATSPIRNCKKKKKLSDVRRTNKCIFYKNEQ